jgi:hypothetical protein
VKIARAKNPFNCVLQRSAMRGVVVAAHSSFRHVRHCMLVRRFLSCLITRKHATQNEKRNSSLDNTFRALEGNTLSEINAIANTFAQSVERVKQTFSCFRFHARFVNLFNRRVTTLSLGARLCFAIVSTRWICPLFPTGAQLTYQRHILRGIAVDGIRSTMVIVVDFFVLSFCCR